MTQEYNFTLPFPIFNNGNGKNKGNMKNENIQFAPLNFGMKSNGRLGDPNSMFEFSMELFGQSVGAEFTFDDHACNVDINMNTKDDKDNIHETYDNDLNILHIHQRILDKLSSLSNTSKNRKEKLLEELKIEQVNVQKPQNYRERMDSMKIIERLQDEIKKNETDIEYHQYIEETRDIINQYNKIGPIRIDLNFGSSINDKSSLDVSDNNEDNYRNYLIEEYIKYASKYIDMNIYKKMKSGNKCPCCDAPINRSITTNDEGSMICPECDIEIPVYLTTSENTDMNDHKKKRSSLDIENFNKKMNEYEGHPPNNAPSDIEEKLDEYFTSYGYPKCSEIRLLPLNPDGRTRGNTSKKLLATALKAIGYSKYYAYMEWICHTFLAWVRHDISSLKPALRHDYQISQPIIDENKGERKSNLNRDYRLFRGLEKLRYKRLDLRDFRMVKEKSLENHDNIWINHVVKGLEWNKPPYNYHPKRIMDMGHS